MHQFLIGLALIASTILIFLVARELVCWYWKINKAMGLLESIDARLKSIDSKDLKLLSKMDSLTQKIPGIITKTDGSRAEVVMKGKRRSPREDIARTQELQIAPDVLEVDCPYCGEKTEVLNPDSQTLQQCRKCGQGFEITP